MAKSQNESFNADGAVGQASLRDLLTVVFKRKTSIIVFAFTVVLLAIVVSVLWTPTYEITATLLVNKARAEIPLAPNDSPQLIINQLSEQDLNSEIEVLKSRQLVEEVLEALEVDEASRPEASRLSVAKNSLRNAFGGTELSYFDAMVVHLQQELKITAVRKSNVIRVSYRSKNPEWATQVVGLLTERYLERRAEMYQSPQAVSFFEEQMLEAESRLNKAEKTLESHLARASITMVQGPQGSDSLAAQKALVMERLARLQNELGDAEVEIQEQQNEVSSLRVRLEKEPERLPSANRYNQDAATEEIERGLAALELERDGLLQDFRPDSRRVRDIDTQIELARGRLADAENSFGTINRTESNPVHLALKPQLLRAEAELEGTSARLSSLQTQLAENHRELDDLNGKAFEIGKLGREAQAAEDDYLLYRKKHEEARISAAMDQQQLINVSIAQPARTPLRPVARGLMMRMIVALVVGVAGGLGLAFAREFYFDHSFTTGEDLERCLGIRNIASIPEDG